MGDVRRRGAAVTPAEICALHDAAMAAEDEGRHADALDMERRAALAETTQPSRAILLRSAATIALAMGDHAEALRLARLGLEGLDVPARVQGELVDVVLEARPDAMENVRTVNMPDDEVTLDRLDWIPCRWATPGVHGGFVVATGARERLAVTTEAEAIAALEALAPVPAAIVRGGA